VKENNNTANTHASQFHSAAYSGSLDAVEASKDIAINGRKDFLRRPTVSVGNIINRNGGTAIRESFSAISNYLSTVNKQERLRQQFGRPENVASTFRLRRQLDKLVKSSNESDANNAQALIKYLNGQSPHVQLQGELSDQLKKSLVEVGDLLQMIWERFSSGKPAPKVIGLSPIQSLSIPNYVHTNLARFAEDTHSVG
jgi:hypothetical protein